LKVYKRYAPPPPLQKYIDCYWSLESNGLDSEEDHRYLPLGCQELLINLGDTWQETDPQNISIPQSSVSGQFTKQKTFKTHGEVHLFSISFKPYGWSLLSGYSAAEFSETMTDATLLKRFWKSLSQKLLEAKTEQERIGITNRELYKYANNHVITSVNIPIEDMIKSLYASRGKTKVKEFAEFYCISLSKLERNFKDLVGLTVKQYARILRLHQILEQYPQSENWVNSIFDLGYFDQAHFTKEFKNFTGTTPGRYPQHSKDIIEEYLLTEFYRLDSLWR
jgi:AraC-like DNA-binding protein